MVLGIALHLRFTREPLSKARVVEVILLYLFIFYVGAGGLLGALGHTLWAKETALKIGWPPGSPFQFEMAMANLAFGVLGILCIWHRGGFWNATGIGIAVLLLGCAYGHLREMIVGSNFAPYNAGAGIIFSDAVIPLTILGLLAARHRLSREGGSS